MPRSYMPREKRRDMFLATAAAIVDEQGWDALSMISLAEAAGVSRQLVYQHFAALDQLLEMTARHMFEDLYRRTREALSTHTGNIATTLEAAQRLTYDLPEGRARALWSIITVNRPAGAGIGRAGRGFRRILSRLWAPVIGPRLGLDEKQSEQVAWMLIMAFWGAHQLVDDRRLGKKEAMARVTWLITRVIGAEATQETVAVQSRRR